jgi:peptidoglycan/LPS O-acetylase OafA/YrhL
MDETKFHGLNWLRAFFSIAVVVWHFNAFPNSTIFEETKILKHSFNYSDFINFNILLFAVPFFIFISLFLFAKKERDFSYLKTRILHLLALYLFWLVFYQVWKHGFSGLNFLVPKSFLHLINLSLKGAYTIYYFFTVLIFNLIFVYFFQRLSNLLVYIFSIISILVLFLAPYFAINLNIPEISAYWNPLNFLPYSLVVIVMVRNFDFIRIYSTTLVFVFLGFSIFLSAVEWDNLVNLVFFKTENYGFPAYARLSLLFGTLAIFLLSLRIKRSDYRIVEFLSKYSLPLYLLQSFYFEISKNISSSFLGLSDKNLIPCCSIFITIVFSYISAFLLQKFILKRKLIFSS